MQWHVLKDQSDAKAWLRSLTNHDEAVLALDQLCSSDRDVRLQLISHAVYCSNDLLAVWQRLNSPFHSPLENSRGYGHLRHFPTRPLAVLYAIHHIDLFRQLQVAAKAHNIELEANSSHKMIAWVQTIELLRDGQELDVFDLVETLKTDFS